MHPLKRGHPKRKDLSVSDKPNIQWHFPKEVPFRYTLTQTPALETKDI